MVEVFKTNVENAGQAGMLVHHIHQTYPAYRASFDLEDCDRILRVESSSGPINPPLLIHLLESLGFHAEELTDELPKRYEHT